MSKMIFIEPKLRCLQCCTPFGGSRKESAFIPFLASRGHPPSAACSPFLCLKSQQWLVESFSGYIALTLTLLPSQKTDYIRLTEIILESSYISRNLIYSHLQGPLLPCEVTYLNVRFQGLGFGRLWVAWWGEGIFLLPQRPLKYFV